MELQAVFQDIKHAKHESGVGTCKGVEIRVVMYWVSLVIDPASAKGRCVRATSPQNFTTFVMKSIESVQSMDHEQRFITVRRLCRVNGSVSYKLATQYRFLVHSQSKISTSGMKYQLLRAI